MSGLSVNTVVICRQVDINMSMLFLPPSARTGQQIKKKKKLCHALKNLKVLSEKWVVAVPGNVIISFIALSGLTTTVEFSRIKDMKHGSNHPTNTLIMVLQHSSGYGLLLWDIFSYMCLHHKEFLHTELKRFLTTEVNELVPCGRVPTRLNVFTLAFFSECERAIPNKFLWNCSFSLMMVNSDDLHLLSQNRLTRSCAFCLSSSDKALKWSNSLLEDK